MSTALIPSPLRFQDIEAKAESIAFEHEFDQEKASVRDLAIRLGGQIIIQDDPDFDTREGGKLIVRGPGDFAIYLSPVTSIQRDNFTIAHELGHYFLHTDSGKLASLEQPIVVKRYLSPEERSTIQSKLEQQANRFAAALLMPEAQFRKAALDPANTVSRLSSLFRVSARAIEVRMSSLGL